jgi:hypothetical protein
MDRREITRDLRMTLGSDRAGGLDRCVLGQNVLLIDRCRDDRRCARIFGGYHRSGWRAGSGDFRRHDDRPGCRSSVPADFIASVHRPRNSRCRPVANDRAPRPKFGTAVARNGPQAKSIACRSIPNDRAANRRSVLAQAGRFRASAPAADSVHKLRAAYLSKRRLAGYRDRKRMPQAMRRPPSRV